METADGWEELAITTTEEDGNTNALVGIGILCLIPFALYACWRKRPKLTKLFMLIWVCWFGYKLWEGDGAKMLKRFDLAGQCTVLLVRALYGFVVAWAQVLIPFLNDLATLLKPVTAMLVETWIEMGSFAQLVTVACTAALVVLYCFFKCVRKHSTTIKDRTVKTASVTANVGLFVASAPLCFLVGAKVPTVWGGRILGTMMTLIPLLFSLRALATEQQAKNQTREEVSLMEKLRALNGKGQGAEDTTSELQERIRRWLAYWSVWPMLSVAIFMWRFVLDMVATEVEYDQRAKFKKELESSGDGVLLALVVWATVWDLSKVVPIATTVADHCCGRCCRRVGSRVGEAANEAGQAVARTAVRNAHLVTAMEPQGCKEWCVTQLKGKWGILLLIVLAVVIAFSVIGKTLAALSYWATWVMLVAAGFDTAFIVAAKDPDLCHQRLAFWSIVALWTQVLIKIPIIATFLTVWTPLVLVLSMVAGRKMLDILLKCLSNTMFCCLRCFLNLVDCSGGTPAAESTEGEAESAQGNAAESPRGKAAGSQKKQKPATPRKLDATQAVDHEAIVREEMEKTEAVLRVAREKFESQVAGAGTASEPLLQKS